MIDILNFLAKADYIYAIKRNINEEVIKKAEEINMGYLEFKNFCLLKNIHGKTMLNSWTLIKLRKNLREHNK